MHDRRPLYLAMTSVLASVALSGCSSGGGGISSAPSTLPPNSGTTISVPPLGPVDVRVAVADSGFDIAAIINSERVIDSLNVHTGGSDVSGGNEWHGNVVSSVITGDELGRARLDLIKVEKDGVTLSSVLDYAIGVAAQRGARVINASFSQRFLSSDPRLSFNGVSSAESYRRVVNANDGNGAVYVISAGNDGLAIDTQGRPIYISQPDLFSMMLIAVGTDSDGNIHPSSSYPGDDTKLQERTIATDFVNRTVDAQGTSISAARISEYAAGIISLWPHLNAQQASQRLLDTASQTSGLYQQNTCGDAANLNCGTFYLGQGEADIEAALAPQGALVVPQSTKVVVGGEPASASFMQLSGAYGNALAASGALDSVSVFDDLGRDYQMDFSSQVQPRFNRSNQLRDQMERMSLSSAQAVQTASMESRHFRFTSRSNNAGELVSSRFDGTYGSSTFSAFHFAGEQVNPMSGYAESGIMPMISFQLGAELTQALNNVNGVKTKYGMSDQLSLSASHWAGGVSDTMSFDNDYSANRSDIEMAYQLTPGISISTHIGRLDEQNGLLGAHGSGALGFGKHNQMTFIGAGLLAKFSNEFAAFAEFEQGRGNADGSGLVTQINDIKAQQMALGLQWQKDDERAALTLRQPLRIDSANAVFSVPVGRTLDGDVMRETREASLSPSGRQVDIELGYTFMPSERSQLQFNLLHTLAPGHNADASSDSAAMVNYLVAW